jgi:hypothetical protein
MRYEAKYLIPRELVPAIRAFVRPFCSPDAHASGDPPEYTITTLQLDDPYYSLHFAKEREALTRFRLRARTYGEIGSSMVFAEVKSKADDTVVKTRAAIPFDVWGETLVLGVRLPDCFEDERHELSFLRFKRLVWELGARPVMLIRYRRESYVGRVDPYARVTFDRQLQYQATDSWTDFGRAGVWRGMDSAAAQGSGLPYSGVVFEVKTLLDVPAWVLDMVERFQLQRQGNCKFSTAVWREGLFRGYPETHAATAETLAPA